MDAGASLGPSRFRLSPHPKEYNAMAICREKMSAAAEKADVITVSHYHFDHHTPSYTDWFCNWSSAGIARGIYEGKQLLVKNYRTKINPSQRRRGWLFTKTGGKHGEKLVFADGKTFEFGDTKLRFSEPVFHGIGNSALGWVLMITVEHEDERVLFTSDVQGPMHTPTLESILSENPQLVIVGGPPTYLSGFRVEEAHIKQGLCNLEILVKRVPVTILEHHLLRDDDWRAQSKPIFDAAERAGHKVVTAAEFVGEKDNPLESHRRLLYENEPPDLQFEKWLKLPILERKKTRPPV
jgi:predicted metallo-beta-lactamase superfamily hydrolase